MTPYILLIQGPNMEYLGKREPHLYGTTTLAELHRMVEDHAKERDYALDIFTTNIEGEAIGRIYQAERDGVDGLVMNPAAFLYAGYALRDCLRAVPLPYVEVHITNIEKRGMTSITASEAVGMVAGLGVQSYIVALDAMLEILKARGQ